MLRYGESALHLMHCERRPYQPNTAQICPCCLIMSCNICFSMPQTKQQSPKRVGGMLQLNSYVKYPASSPYHLTRLIFMKTSSPRIFTAVLTLAASKRCSFATGRTFSNSRASFSSQLRSLTTLLARDARRGDPHSNGL